MLREAKPVELAGTRLVIEFPPWASFHRNLAEEPKNVHLLVEVLHEVTGRRLTPAFSIGEGPAEEPGAEGERTRYARTTSCPCSSKLSTPGRDSDE